MQICTSPQTDNHAGIPPLSFFTGWMPFLPPNQQRQSTKGSCQNAPKATFLGVKFQKKYSGWGLGARFQTPPQ